MACGTGAEPQQMPEVPAADGEAWDVRFEIGRPGHRIEIRAAYVREFSQAQQVRAEGGVEVAFLEGEAWFNRGEIVFEFWDPQKSTYKK